MSKKILSLLLVLTLLVTVSVFAVEATDPENSEVVYSNPTKEAFDAAVLAAGEEAATLDFYCEACDKVVTWTKNTSTAIPNKKGAGGHTYIPSGSKAVGQQIVGVSSSGEYAKTVTEENGDRSTTFCLYLNGDIYRDISGTNEKNQYLFRLYGSNSEIDTTVPYHVTMNVMGNGTARMYTTGTPVKEDSNTGPQNGAIINLSTNTTNAVGGTCTLNIYEGAVIGNQGSVGMNGLVSGIQAYHTINMYGGRIDGGTPSGGHGGAVYLTSGAIFNMHGGEIHGSDVGGQRGGALYLNGKASAFNMGTEAALLNTEHLPAIYGGTTTSYGGAVCVMSGAFNMGAGTISGGTADYGGSVVLSGTNAKMNMFGGEIVGGTTNNEKYAGGAVNVNSKATFNMYKGAAITGGTSNGRGGGSVFLNSGGKFNMYGGVIVGGKSLLKSWTVGTAVTVNTGAEVNSQFNMYGGTITDDENTSGTSLVYGYTDSGVEGISTITINENAELPDDAPAGAQKEADALIDATGKRRAVQANRSAVVLEEGVLDGGVDASVSGASVYLTAATFDMNGGTIQNGSNSQYGGNVFLTNGSEFTMDGGKILSGTAENSGGNVFAEQSTFTMNNGTIALGTSSKHGGNVYIAESSTFTMNNGTVAGGTLNTAGTSNFGGNVGIMHGNTFTMNGGLMTPVYGETTGGSRNGDNIGVWNESTGCEVNLLGGEIVPGSGTGDVLYLASAVEGGTSVTIGAVNIAGNVEGTSDIYAYKALLNQKFTFKEGFTGATQIYVESGETPLLNGKTVNAGFAVADGYTNAGTIVISDDGERYPLVGSGTDMVLAPFAVTNGARIVTDPKTADEAAAYELAEGQYIKLFQAGQTLNLTKATTVDFNGNDTTVNGAQYLKGMDAATNDYKQDGAAVVTTDVAPELNNVVDLTINGKSGQRKYLALANGDGTYSYHRYYLSVDKFGLRSADNSGNEQNPGLMYSGVFRGDEVVLANMTEYGVQFVDEDHQFLDGTAPETTAKTEGKKWALHGWLAAGKGDIDVPAQAYIKVAGQTIYSSAVTKNLKGVTEGFVADYNAGNLAESFCSILENMIEACKDLMNGWAIALNKPEVA